jgi:hypothetical protein
MRSLPSPLVHPLGIEPSRQPSEGCVASSHSGAWGCRPATTSGVLVESYSTPRDRELRAVRPGTRRHPFNALSYYIRATGRIRTCWATLRRRSADPIGGGGLVGKLDSNKITIFKRLVVLPSEESCERMVEADF